MPSTLHEDLCIFMTNLVINITMIDLYFMKVTIVSLVVIVTFISMIAIVTNITSRRNVGQPSKRWTDQHPWRWSKPGWLILCGCCYLYRCCCCWWCWPLIISSPYLPRLQEYKCSYSYLRYKGYQCSLVAVVTCTCLKCFTLGTFSVLVEYNSNCECAGEVRIILFYRAVKMLNICCCSLNWQTNTCTLLIFFFIY